MNCLHTFAPHPWSCCIRPWRPPAASGNGGEGHGRTRSAWGPRRASRSVAWPPRGSCCPPRPSPSCATDRGCPCRRGPAHSRTACSALRSTCCHPCSSSNLKPLMVDRGRMGKEVGTGWCLQKLRILSKLIWRETGREGSRRRSGGN